MQKSFKRYAKFVQKSGGRQPGGRQPVAGRATAGRAESRDATKPGTVALDDGDRFGSNMAYSHSIVSCIWRLPHVCKCNRNTATCPLNVCRCSTGSSNPPGPCGLSRLGTLSSLSSFGRKVYLSLNLSPGPQSSLRFLLFLAVDPSKQHTKPVNRVCV